MVGGGRVVESALTMTAVLWVDGNNINIPACCYGDMEQCVAKGPESSKVFRTLVVREKCARHRWLEVSLER